MAATVKQVPGVAIGNTRVCSGCGKFTGVANAFKQAEQNRLKQFAVGGTENPGG